MSDLVTKQIGSGINTTVTLSHQPSGYVATISGTTAGRKTMWYASVRLPVPADRVRKPPAVRWWAGQPSKVAEPATAVSCEIGHYESRKEATDAATVALRTWNFAAKLDDVIEAEWRRLYEYERKQYLIALNTGPVENRIAMIRRLRKSDPAFAELFPEPPVLATASGRR